MLKTESLLQLLFIGMTAGIIALLAVRFYPSEILDLKKVSAQILIDPLPFKPQKREITPPTAINIPQLNLNLSIAPGSISNNEWTLYEDKVSWLSTSKTPGEGNVILYAHNKEPLFGNLKNLRPGDQIELEHAGKKYSYKVVEKRRVLPTDIDEILSEQDQLTLYTCDGSFDQKRLIVVALPIQN